MDIQIVVTVARPVFVNSLQYRQSFFFTIWNLVVINISIININISNLLWLLLKHYYKYDYCDK